ncbi:hypothetical protein [Pseudomonas schmalbachii]|uniref:Lipoprotein n=1 Tax=Pseudomonas schmalbachii TaxID=2816993 RepID=A0ABS3TXB3_9PSED|nr:hypothetical protein [Pseudomonas schmalbachii]MBO3277290.1 hypothetical protein [Pseudomonas schmalbachii]
MRRILAAILLFLPLTGCVVHEHDHYRDRDRDRGWRGGQHYHRSAPPPGYYKRDRDRDWDRGRNYRWR